MKNLNLYRMKYIRSFCNPFYLNKKYSNLFLISFFCITTINSFGQNSGLLEGKSKTNKETLLRIESDSSINKIRIFSKFIDTTIVLTEKDSNDIEKLFPIFFHEEGEFNVYVDFLFNNTVNKRNVHIIKIENEWAGSSYTTGLGYFFTFLMGILTPFFYDRIKKFFQDKEDYKSFVFDLLIILDNIEKNITNDLDIDKYINKSETRIKRMILSKPEVKNYIYSIEDLIKKHRKENYLETIPQLQEVRRKLETLI